MKILFALLLIPLLITPAFAQTNSQTLPTEKGTLDVNLSYDDIDPGDQTSLIIQFINPQTQKVHLKQAVGKVKIRVEIRIQSMSMLKISGMSSTI